MHAHAEGAPAAGARSFLHRPEGGVLVVAFLLSMAIPLIDALGRPFHGFGVPGSAEYRAHLTLSTAEAIGRAKLRDAARVFSSSVAAAVCAVLAYSAYGVVAADREQGKQLAIGLPVWVSECVMPLAFGLLALRMAWGASSGWKGRAVAFATIAAAFALGLVPTAGPALSLPLVAVIV